MILCKKKKKTLEGEFSFLTSLCVIWLLCKQKAILSQHMTKIIT